MEAANRWFADESGEGSGFDLLSGNRGVVQGLSESQSHRRIPKDARPSRRFHAGAVTSTRRCGY